ncbi:MAG: VIT1/CCC1 family protein [Sphaerochaetaceae bacterium]|nr:VIT1/CCC1 family protein [Sphaerochaetaceae bacterium]
MLREKTIKIILGLQKNEKTESLIYKNIASSIKGEENKEVLNKISEEESKHEAIWKKYTKQEVSVNRGRVRRIGILAKIFGYTFILKKMENGEDAAQKKYKTIIKEVPEAETIMQDEQKHEAELLELLDEERLKYVGSMVLGLSDALVEISGTLAGLTFALRSTKLIALSGLITGISATLSMASSEYLSSKSSGDKNAGIKSVYTGVAYLLTVILMVLPFLLFGDSNYSFALISMLMIVVLIILGFSYYISVANNLSFKKRFFEMSGISLSVAGISFVIGILVKRFLGVDI